MKCQAESDKYWKFGTLGSGSKGADRKGKGGGGSGSGSSGGGGGGGGGDTLDEEMVEVRGGSISSNCTWYENIPG